MPAVRTASGLSSRSRGAAAFSAEDLASTYSSIVPMSRLAGRSGHRSRCLSRGFLVGLLLREPVPLPQPAAERHLLTAVRSLLVLAPRLVVVREPSRKPRSQA